MLKGVTGIWDSRFCPMGITGIWDLDLGNLGLIFGRRVGGMVPQILGQAVL